MKNLGVHISTELATLAEAMSRNEALPKNAQAHLETCPACKAALNTLVVGLRTLQEEQPPGQSVEQENDLIIGAFSKARVAGPIKNQFGIRLLWWGFAPALALGLALFFVVRPQFFAPELWVETGEVQSAQNRISSGGGVRLSQQIEVTGEIAALRLRDGTGVRARQGSVLLVQRSAGFRVGLTRGHVECDVSRQKDGERFVVETKEALIAVLGTSFSVDRGEMGTSVAVQGGQVEVRPTVGESVILGPGGFWPSRQKEISQPETIVEAPANAPEPERPVRVEEIRRRIRAGHLDSARRMISGARTVNDKPAVLAELATLEAEALLAEGKVIRAEQTYLNLFRRYRQTEQAQAGLFAAVQTAIDRNDHQAALAHIKTYRENYPKGRFLEEVERLLRALESRSR